MSEEIYRHNKTILGFLPRVTTILLLLLLGFGKLTFGEHPFNFAPLLAATLFIS